ncbi:hypothetical protein [Sphingomonas sp. LHG3406-1]|uniref:hypothetical protein n=1 Tax=Sphingomonas sp. LHG3406-1 TaxID=2804617 RepID=UPI00261354B8|nr:hypothetical protein [Sphingomonas sp. LHG3406-1]
MFAIIAAAAAAAANPSAVTVNAPRSIEIDGVRAIYTRHVDADGITHLKGRYGGRNATRFHFRVRGKEVEGWTGGAPVRFTMPGR